MGRRLRFATPMLTIPGGHAPFPYPMCLFGATAQAMEVMVEKPTIQDFNRPSQRLDWHVTSEWHW